MTDQPLIQCTDLGKAYVTGDVTTYALRSATCTIDNGEFVSIMGPSGSGKSTFMHLLSFLEEPTSGTYLYKGRDTKTISPRELARLRNQEIGFIFQAFNLLPGVSVYDNVELPLLYDFYTRGNTRAIHKKRVLTALESVGLTHRTEHKTEQLSGGEKQRVAIARALVNNPTLIFADEPTGNLDSKAGNRVMRTLQELCDQGHTIVLVTHEQATAEHGTRIINLVDGTLTDDHIVTNRRIAQAHGTLKK